MRGRGRRSSLVGIANHYDVLGVRPDASPEAIRAAYRDRARLHHPDRAGSAAAGEMAAVNEAYRVLSDPGRRTLYDRRLRGGSAGAERRAATDVDDPLEESDDHLVVRPSFLAPDGPARVPWKMMGLVTVVGSSIILFASAFAQPPSEESPDGILRIGSCVAIEPNGDAREVACTGEDDVVVELLVPTDARCPQDTEPHRDRLGLGIACIGA